MSRIVDSDIIIQDYLKKYIIIFCVLILLEMQIKSDDVKFVLADINEKQYKIAENISIFT